LPSDYINEKEAEAIVTMWLKTSYSKNPRHVRRIKKISALEK
jgi:ribose 5-phosphate isomerase RpiB